MERVRWPSIRMDDARCGRRRSRRTGGFDRDRAATDRDQRLRLRTRARRWGGRRPGGAGRSGHRRPRLAPGRITGHRFGAVRARAGARPNARAPHGPGARCRGAVDVGRGGSLLVSNGRPEVGVRSRTDAGATNGGLAGRARAGGAVARGKQRSRPGGDAAYGRQPSDLGLFSCRDPDRTDARVDPLPHSQLRARAPVGPTLRFRARAQPLSSAACPARQRERSPGGGRSKPRVVSTQRPVQGDAPDRLASIRAGDSAWAASASRQLAQPCRRCRPRHRPCAKRRRSRPCRRAAMGRPAPIPGRGTQ